MNQKTASRKGTRRRPLRNKTGNSENESHRAVMGLALTATAIAALGAYLLYGSKNAPRNRAKVKSWMLRARAEVLEKLEGSELITREEYQAIIDAVAKRYANLKGATRREIQDFKREMTGGWPKLQDSAKSTAKVAGRAAVKAAAVDVARRVVRRMHEAEERDALEDTQKKGE